MVQCALGRQQRLWRGILFGAGEHDLQGCLEFMEHAFSGEPEVRG